MEFEMKKNLLAFSLAVVLLLTAFSQMTAFAEKKKDNVNHFGPHKYNGITVTGVLIHKDLDGDGVYDYWYVKVNYSFLGIGDSWETSGRMSIRVPNSNSGSTDPFAGLDEGNYIFDVVFPENADLTQVQDEWTIIVNSTTDSLQTMWQIDKYPSSDTAFYSYTGNLEYLKVQSSENERYLNIELNTYPVPANTFLNIDLNINSKGYSQSEKNCLIQIFDLNGAVIHEFQTNQSNNRVELTDVPNGTYLIRASNPALEYTAEKTVIICK